MGFSRFHRYRPFAGSTIVLRLVLVLAATTACTGAPGGDGGAATGSVSATTPRPGCAGPGDDVQDITLDPAINLRVTVLLTGDGPRGVALYPQSDGDICQLADLAHRLAQRGYRAVTFGPWSSPYTRPAEAAYRALTAAGAQRVVLVGASQGAAVALATAASLTPVPAGAVSLSAESSAGGTIDALAGASAFGGPVLLAGTEDDIYAPGGVTRRIAELHPGSEQVLLFDGSAHGIELLPRVSDEIDAFLATALPA